MFSNNLSPAQIERLALLSEECAEVIVMVNKILRHGYDSYHPDDTEMTPNTSLLEYELGDVQYSISLMGRFNDIHTGNVAIAEQQAAHNKPRYLHFQPLTHKDQNHD